MGESPEEAAEKGRNGLALPVLAATLTSVVVFFLGTFFYGVSQFLFVALAMAVVISLFASFFVARTVVPLFCAKFIKGHFDQEMRKNIQEQLIQVSCCQITVAQEFIGSD